MSTLASAQSKNLKPQGIVLDLVKAVRTCDKNKTHLLKFVNYAPDEVPIIPGEIEATLTRKMNKVCSAVVDLKERVTLLKAQSLSVVQSPSLPPIPVVKPTYLVILKQPPKGLDKPAQRKDYFESLADSACCSYILDLKPLRKEWRIVLDNKKAAASLANSAQDAKLKAPLLLGMIRHVPDDISDLDLCAMIRNCVKAEKIRQTRSYKLAFEQKLIYREPVRNLLFLVMRGTELRNTSSFLCAVINFSNMDVLRKRARTLPVVLGAPVITVSQWIILVLVL